MINFEIAIDRISRINLNYKISNRPIALLVVNLNQKPQPEVDRAAVVFKLNWR
ncbi:hypothetical protein IQ269_26535 [Tychonema sp. LEGE 07199]|uniref:hypothetical protein n=1 Tax=Microcoleaceae TaxID=1892252 RepID=UPI00188022C4|nr:MULTISPECIES: hypothetical protein [unclassified Tychonema]MBE9124259.1 hypothetical protein [Tychonema sp. LEGE 07199]MBE9133242.1 hypothetical protein [Tychonema sp. LEGE 07196]MBE9165844.1 hypothetical protein [Tychonema sp. LEGE 06208]